MNIQKLSKLSFACCGLSAIFAISLLSFSSGITFLSFLISAIFTVVLSFFIIKKLFNKDEKKNASFIPVVRLLLQYEPYVLLISFVLRRAGEFETSFALDVIQVILWCLVVICVLSILTFIKPKQLKKFAPEWNQFLVDKKYEESKKKKNGLYFIGKETLSWIDALAQSVFLVLLLNIFVVQLYSIPSESMVPEFLISDRLVVFKIFNGPKFPMSKVGLPSVKDYKRGEIVVFRNPHYKNDRKSEFKTFISQLVYMCTFTLKNINLDENGQPKTDPLVKRITGVPGEQLMMVDGKLYSKTKDSEFKIVDEPWACWNLNSVKEPVKSGIKDFVFPQEYFDEMLKLEEKRANFDYATARKECEEIAEKFALIHKDLSFIVNGNFELSTKDMIYNNLLSKESPISMRLFASQNAVEWFRDFMTNWEAVDFGDDLYSFANYKLSLMIKINFGKIILRNAELLRDKVPASSWNEDSTKFELFKDAQMLFDYVTLNERRNMPIFPSNDENGNPQFIPENCYFMMGDNRFNSLDLRHSYDTYLIPVSDSDKNSVLYNSSMAPQYVSKERILGAAWYRFWPVSRRGVVGKTGM